MHGDIAGGKGDNLADGIQEGIHVVTRKPGDQVHVDALEPGGPGLPIGRHGLGGGMIAADTPQDIVRHGLGVDAHAVGAAAADGLELL